MREWLYHILFATVEPLLGLGPSFTLFLVWCGCFLGRGLFYVQLADCATAPPPAQVLPWDPMGEIGMRQKEKLSCQEVGQTLSCPERLLDLHAWRHSGLLSAQVWVLWSGDWTPEPTRESPSNLNYSGSDEPISLCSPVALTKRSESRSGLLLQRDPFLGEFCFP